MAQLKKDPNWLADTLAEAVKRMGEVIDHRYYVVEVKDPWESWGYYGSHEPGWTRKISPYFKTPEEATEHMEKYEPTDGDRLEIRHEKLYERVVHEWH